MSNQQKHLLQDLIFLLTSIGFAVFLVESGITHTFVASLGSLQWVGIILTGIFFTSIFTTAPAIGLLGTFAETTPLPVLAILGGFGAVLGDYIIFRFVKDRISKDFEYLFTISKANRFSYIFEHRIFRFFVPFIGALIIASPFPDEIGVAMLGASKLKTEIFFLLSFTLNGAGIFVIGLVAKAIVVL